MVDIRVHQGQADICLFLSGLERLSIECRKTKTKPVTYQLDYSANLEP